MTTIINEKNGKTTKFHTTITMDDARIKASEIIGTFEKDEVGTKNAGYTIYQSVENPASYICDLSNRLEVNIDGESINIWIAEAMSLESMVRHLNTMTTEDSDRSEFLKHITETIKQENSDLRKFQIAEFADLAHDDVKAFWEMFIAEPTAIQRKMVYDRENDTYALDTWKKRIRFEEVDQAYTAKHKHGATIARSREYVAMPERICHNLACLKVNNLNDKLPDNVKKVAMPKASFKYAEPTSATCMIKGKAVKINWTKNSLTGIREQVQAYLDTIMPEDMRVLLVSADLNYIVDAFSVSKNKTTTTADERSIDIIIFDALAVRYAEAGYIFKSKAKCHKEPKPQTSERTEKQEEQTSKIPNRPEAETTLSKPQTEAVAA